MAKKIRIPIPNDTAADILFLSDRTCCVCNTRGKQVQIHHLDENPANNNIYNLSVLCFDCHNQTMIKGGFGRKLEVYQIIKYRKDWLDRVKSRRDKADEIASLHTVTGSTEIKIENYFDNEDLLNYKTNIDPDLLKDYLQKILIVHKAQLVLAQVKWDSGITAIMNQGNYDMVDFYEEVLIELSTFYPKGHFNNLPPKNYFSEIISGKFLWYRLVLEFEGIGNGGTIVTTIIGGNVMNDLSQMVVNMVSTLLKHYNIEVQIDFNNWCIEWTKSR